MKPLLLLVVFLPVLYIGVQAQNIDLPGLTANPQSPPSRSYSIAMDNTSHQSKGQMDHYRRQSA